MRKFLALVALALPLCAGVELTRHDDDHISVAIDGKPFTDFYFGKTSPKPYLWPLRAATGTVVTRAYPIDASVPGATHDHPTGRYAGCTDGRGTGSHVWANEPS